MQQHIIDEVKKLLQSVSKASIAKPVQAVGQLVVVHVSRGTLLLVGVISRDMAALVVVELLHRIGDLLELYLRELTEDALRANFVTVYQLLDEITDNGAPLHTEPNVLQQLVMQPGKMETIVASISGASHVRGTLPESPMPWRRAGVRHTSNELYLDLLERVDAVIDAESGVLQRAEVSGDALCSCNLSGMPRLTLTLNTPRVVDDAALHQCVAHDRWERERVLNFVPPDGKSAVRHLRRHHRTSARRAGCAHNACCCVMPRSWYPSCAVIGALRNAPTCVPTCALADARFPHCGSACVCARLRLWQLFSYRVSRTHQLPLYVTPTIDFNVSARPAAKADDDAADATASGGAAADARAGGRIGNGPNAALGSSGSGGSIAHFYVTVGARPTGDRPVDEATIRIPLPESASSATLSATVGTYA